MRNRPYNGCELQAIGLVRAKDGHLLDNRDGFHVEHPDDYLRLYDSRTHAAISRSLLEKLISAIPAT